MLKWLIISTIHGLLTIFLDDSSYHESPPPPITIYIVLNLLGICSWVCIHVTVISWFHTTITSERPKELSVHFLPLSRVWGWGAGGGLSERLHWENQGNRKWKGQNDQCSCCSPEGRFYSHWREPLATPSSSCIMAGFSFSLFLFLSSLSAAEFSNGFPVWSWVKDCHLVSREAAWVGFGGFGHFSEAVLTF